MKLHLIMYMVNIAQDIRHFIRNYSLTKRTKFVSYSSDIVEKITLSVEMIVEMVYGKKEVDLFTKKKSLFKVRELKNLSSVGFNFYLEKNIYLSNVLEMSEEEFENRLKLIDDKSFLQIQNMASNKLMQHTDKIEIPEKILNIIKEKKLEKIKMIIKEDKVMGLVENKDELKKDSLKERVVSLYKTIRVYVKFLLQYISKGVNFVEILYIIRPLTYLLSMVVFKRKSFVPLLINLLIDLVILKTKRKNENFEGQRAYSYEYSYRLSKLSVYLLREPIYSFFTKPYIRKLMKLLRIPTFISELVMVLLSYYTNLYFIL